MASVQPGGLTDDMSPRLSYLFHGHIYFANYTPKSPARPMRRGVSYRYDIRYVHTRA